MLLLKIGMTTYAYVLVRQYINLSRRYLNTYTMSSANVGVRDCCRKILWWASSQAVPTSGGGWGH